MKYNYLEQMIDAIKVIFNQVKKCSLDFLILV